MPEKLRDPPICIRLPPALDARMRRKVEADASTITDYVRGLIERDLPAPEAPARPPRAVRVPAGRVSMKACPHRMGAGSFCKRCGSVV